MTETYHHGNLRNDLISEGLKLLCKNGIAAFSLRNLSKELGVSHAAAYRHFSSKEDLVRAILIEFSARFRQALLSSVSPGATDKEALMQLGVGYVRFFLAQPELISLFTLIPSEGDPLSRMLSESCESHDSMIELGSHRDCTNIDSLPDSSGFGFFRRIALALRDEEEYRELSDREILLGFWGKVHGIATILITQKRFIPPESIDATIERVVRTAF
jgi:AcrR family transcriptional regulator